MEWNNLEIEDAVQEELGALLGLLQFKEEIIRYQAAEQAIEKNEWVQAMIEKIKQRQKELVNFEYYEKPQAHQLVKAELEQLNAELESSLSVQTYRDTLWEANEIVQLLFQRLQTAVDEATQLDQEKQ